MTYLSQVGLALTRLGNALIGGLAEESMSSRAWRAEQNGKWWGKRTRPFIDWLLSLFGDRHHCSREYREDRNKAQLPMIRHD